MSRDDARRPAGGPARCGVHLLQFATYTETRCPVVGGEGFVPVFREELATLGPAGCVRPVSTPGFSPSRVPLAAEDVVATANRKLFDEDGYLTMVCQVHAEFLTAHAVLPRACAGPQCRGRAAPGLACALTARRPGHRRGRRYCFPGRSEPA